MRPSLDSPRSRATPDYSLRKAPDSPRRAAPPSPVARRRRAGSLQSVDTLMDAMRSPQMNESQLSIMTEFISMKPISLAFSKPRMEADFRAAYKSERRPRFQAIMVALALFFAASAIADLVHQSGGWLGWLKLGGAIVSAVAASLHAHICTHDRGMELSSGTLAVLALVCQMLNVDTDGAAHFSSDRSHVGLTFLLYVAVGCCLRFLASLHISLVLMLLSVVGIWIAPLATEAVALVTKVEDTVFVTVGFVLVNVVLLRQIEIHERREYRLIKRLTAENVHVQMQMENFTLFSDGVQKPKNAMVSPGGVLSPACLIDANDVELHEVIGCGAHGEAVRGKFKGTIVAVKKIKHNGAPDAHVMANIGAEASLMADLRHPNIVMFMGVCLVPPMLVMEYCSRGSVYDTLHIKSVRLDWSLLLRILLDATQGMSFLHQSKPAILHRDLKSPNLLLDSTWRCKVADFGLSSFKEGKPSPEALGSVPWMAPEVFQDGTVTEKADVYAMGIILFECLAKAAPYSDIPTPGIPHVVNSGRRPTDYQKIDCGTLPEAIAELVPLMELCWDPTPDRRPSFEAIVSQLETSVCPKFFGGAAMVDAIVFPKEKLQKTSLDGDAFNIRESDLKFGLKIGGGGYGVVFAGKWLGTNVAIKKMFVKALSEKGLEDFHQECNVMRQLRHPNIVLFLGSSAKSPNLYLVTELLTKGSLFDVYHSEKPIADATTHYERVLQVAKDMARGMTYLHALQPPLIHRDMKSPNVMVDAHWVCKIGDFGLSRIKDESKTVTTCGSPLWVAPEVLLGKKFAEGCDIYSFAIIVWEMATWSEPYPGMKSKEVMMQVATKGLRPTLPDVCPPDLKAILLDCWKPFPTDRPAFSTILERLTHIELGPIRHRISRPPPDHELRAPERIVVNQLCDSLAEIMAINIQRQNFIENRT
ncbi:Aste57867_23799 [Aphanomyces stellatus]|uniref:Aste57867_23799 protein n=1 Tax=Aphanomyces stellatus TaxID=120398 RepID=A0A485LPG2_9STRA|nr:hypothetical protein As57867_023726 [Aphanomyces stellatus]VFU00444.1 Aste57867_23799 [Aphanomyces stellatus]